MMDGNDLASETTRRGIISQAWTRISQEKKATQLPDDNKSMLPTSMSSNDLLPSGNFSMLENNTHLTNREIAEEFGIHHTTVTDHIKSLGFVQGQELLQIRNSQAYQGTLDKWTPHTKGRWLGSILLLAIFVLRIITKQGWYIVTYALGIYHLNLFIAFLTPKIDPAMDFDADDENGPALPTRATEEFRPFIRRLPEFKFWLSVTKSTIIAFFCTFVDAFNIPVFWPILVMYFITLFCITMKRQIKHMIKYRYLPFTHSKPKYKTVESTVTVN